MSEKNAMLGTLDNLHGVEAGLNVPIKSVYKLAKGLGYTEEEIRIELYGDTKYLYMVDNHKALMDKIYDKLVKKQISEEKIHAMIDIVDNS